MMAAIKEDTAGTYAAKASFDQYVSATDGAISSVTERVNKVVDTDNNIKSLAIARSIADNTEAVNALKSQFTTTIDGTEVGSIVESKLAAALDKASYEAAATTLRGMDKVAGAFSTFVDANGNAQNLVTTSMVSTLLDNDNNVINAASVVNAINNSASTVKIAATKTDIEVPTAASIFVEANREGSSITLNADKINIDANHQLDLSAQDITLAADKVTFTNADGTITDKISIDPTTGTFRATDAIISGQIAANKGTIAGFNIGETGLIATDIDSGFSNSPHVHLMRVHDNTQTSIEINP